MALSDIAATAAIHEFQLHLRPIGKYRNLFFFLEFYHNESTKYSDQFIRNRFVFYLDFEISGLTIIKHMLVVFVTAGLLHTYVISTNDFAHSFQIINIERSFYFTIEYFTF